MDLRSSPRPITTQPRESCCGNARMEELVIHYSKTESYKAGYEAGWMDGLLDDPNPYNRLSTWGHFAQGYHDGRWAARGGSRR